MRHQHPLIQVFLLTLLLIAQPVAGTLCASLNPPTDILPSAYNRGLTIVHTSYLAMPEKAKLEFIMGSYKTLAAKISNRPVQVPDDAVSIIKYWIDAYAQRIGNNQIAQGKEDLRFIFKRAIFQYAPTIIRAFKENYAPPLVGVYLPLIETEYQNTATKNAAGAAGLFQFTGRAAKAYGVAAERTNTGKIAVVAARYVKDRLTEFGADAVGVGLLIAGYNRRPDSVRRDLRPIFDSQEKEQEFWALVKNKAKLGQWEQKDNIQLVPRFFAAAIIGENPHSFGLQMLPLSSYAEAPAVKTLPAEQLEKAAQQVIHQISQDSSYRFSPRALNDIRNEVEFQRYHTTWLTKSRRRFSEKGKEVQAETLKQGIPPNLLIYAAMADAIFKKGAGVRWTRRDNQEVVEYVSDYPPDDAVWSAEYILRDMVELRPTFGSDFGDQILLTLAALRIPTRTNEPHPLLATMQRVVKNPQTERNVWYLHEQGEISPEAYDFVLRFLAVGIIAQDLN